MQLMTTPARSVGRGTLDGFETVILSAGELEAAFAPGAGMAGVSFRHAGEELLDRRAGLRTYVERGAVMGIPLLHPWANRLAGFDYAVDGRRVRLPDGPPLVRCEEHGLPIHGLLSGSPHWRVRSAAGNSDGAARVSAALDFAGHPELLAAFPFPHTLTLDVALDAGGLTVATTLTATGDVAVPVAFGFHPYLRLLAVDRLAWRRDLPARRYPFTDTRGIPTGRHEDEHAAQLRLDPRSFDDGFARIADRSEFAVSGGGRRITVTFVSGYPAAQIFSPPGAQFVCFEPMTAPTNVLRSGDGLRLVQPGRGFSAVFRVDVSAQVSPKAMTNLGAAVVRGLAIAAILVARRRRVGRRPAGPRRDHRIRRPARGDSRSSWFPRRTSAPASRRPSRPPPRHAVYVAADAWPSRDEGMMPMRRMAHGAAAGSATPMRIDRAAAARGESFAMAADRGGPGRAFRITAAAGHRVRPAFATVLGGTVLADADPKIIGAAQAVAAGAVLAVVSLAIVPHAFETVSRQSAVATVAASSPARRSAETTFHRRCRNERRRRATACQWR